MIEVKNISFRYEDSDEKNILNNVSFSIGEGECLAILGPSGCGKSTLLKLMSGLLRPDKGQVLYQDEQIRRPIRDIAFLTQDYGLLPWKTVEANIKLPLRIRHEKIEKSKWERLVGYLGLEKELKKYTMQLSGGQAQRVALGRTILAKSKVVLMDEPFSALDIVTKDKLQKFMKKLFKDRKMTSVIVTHNIKEAVYMGDRVAVFDAQKGQIVKIFENSDPRIEESIKGCFKDEKEVVELIG